MGKRQDLSQVGENGSYKSTVLRLDSDGEANYQIRL